MPTAKKTTPAKKPAAAAKPAAPKKAAKPTPALTYPLLVMCTAGPVDLVFDSAEARQSAIDQLTVATGSNFRGGSVEICTRDGTYQFADAHLCYLRY